MSMPEFEIDLADNQLPRRRRRLRVRLRPPGRAIAVPDATRVEQPRTVLRRPRKRGRRGRLIPRRRGTRA